MDQAALITDPVKAEDYKLKSLTYRNSKVQNQKVRFAILLCLACDDLTYCLYVVYDMMCDTMKGGRTCLEYAPLYFI